MRLCPNIVGAIILIATCSPTDAARVPADEVVAAALANRLEALAMLLPTHGMLLEIQRVAVDTGLSIGTRELALYRFALQLRDDPIDATSWSAMEALTQYQAQALHPHPESHGDYRVPLFNVAAAARGTLNVWLRRQAEVRAAQALAQADNDYWAALATRTLHPQQIAGIAAALSLAEAEAVQGLREPLLQALQTSQALAPIAVAAAKTLQDPEIADAVLRYGSSADKAQLVRTMDTIIGVVPATERWIRLTGTSADLAGLAMHRLAALGEGPHLTPLLAGLGDPITGGAAAYALGTQGVATQQLIHELNSDAPPLHLARAALALELNGSPAAKSALAIFRTRQGVKPPPIHRERPVP